MTIPDTVYSIGKDAFKDTAWWNELSDGIVECNGCVLGVKGDCPANVYLYGRRIVADGAFSGCTGLETVSLSAVEYIGARAFAGCTGLQATAYVSDYVSDAGTGAFDGCAGLRIVYEYGTTFVEGSVLCDVDCLIDVTIQSDVTYVEAEMLHDTPWWNRQPDGIVSIDGWVLGWKGECPAQVVIPSGTCGIAGGAFDGCETLESVEIPDGVLYINAYAFTDTAWWNAQDDGVIMLGGWVLGVKEECPENIVLPAGTRGIVAEAFSWYENLKSVVIPAGVECISQSAFYGCSALTSVTIPEGVTHIGDAAFYECTSLQNLTIPEGVTHIGDAAFYGCTSLRDVVIPESVETIGVEAFADCEGLRTVTISTPKISEYAFGGGYNLNLIFRDGVRAITADIMSEFLEVNSVTIPDSVVRVEKFSLEDSQWWDDQPDGVLMLEGWVVGVKGECPVNVVLPEGVRGIADEAFAGNEYIESVNIPSSVAHVGQWAFEETQWWYDQPDGLIVLDGWVLGLRDAEEPYLDPWPEAVVLPSDIRGVADNALDEFLVYFSDGQNSYTLKPDYDLGNEVDIVPPDNIDAKDVTVEIGGAAPYDIGQLRLNGAKLKVFGFGDVEITDLLTFPEADEDGWINMEDVRVKSEIAREALDPKKGASFTVVNGEPVIVTAPTHPGLFYFLNEGETLDDMWYDENYWKFGDGESWTPEVTVKGGNSGFYSIVIDWRNWAVDY